MERVIPKLRKLYRNCESYIKIETAQKQLVLQSKKIKFLAHLPNQSLLRWIKREMKVLTWFGRACVAQCAPMGLVCPMRPATGSPTHYNVQIRESPAKWPLHCTSLYFNAQSVSCDISIFLKQMTMLCVKTCITCLKQHFLFLNYRLQNQGSHQRPNRIDFCSHCDKVLNFSFVGVLSWPI